MPSFPPRSPRHRLHAAGLGLGLFAVYVASAPRTVTLEDSGDFIMASYFAGIPHAPGFPIHTLLGHLFTWLPVGSVAFRVHLLSASAAALACVALFFVVSRLSRHESFALAAAAVYGLSPLFWSQAIIAEVYSLNAFFFFGLFALGMSYREQPALRSGLVFALLYGFALSNHPQLILLSTPAFLALLWPGLRIRVRDWPWMAVVGFLGLLPYAFLVLRSQAVPEVSFTGPIWSLDDFVYFVGRFQFSEIDANLAADTVDKLRFLLFLSQETIRQYTIVGVFLAAVGFAVQWFRWPRGIALALALAWFANSALLAGLLAFDFEWQSRIVFSAYPTVAYGVVAAWIVLGLEAMTDRFALLRHRALRAVLCVAVVLLSVFSSGRAAWRADDTWARDYAQFLLESMEPDAVLFTVGHFHLGPLGYLNLVEGVRPDVTLMNENGLVFSNRLFHPHVAESRAHAAIAGFVLTTDRPVYFMQPSDVRLPYPVDEYGLFKRIRSERMPGPPRFMEDARLLSFMEGVEAMEARDAWTRFHREQLRGKAARWLVGLAAAGSDWETARRARLLESISSDYIGRMVVIADRANAGTDPGLLLEELAQAQSLLSEKVSNSTRAQLYFFRAKPLLDLGRVDEAVASLERSVAIHPHPANQAIFHLARLYEWAGRDDDHRALLERFSQGP